MHPNDKAYGIIEFFSCITIDEYMTYMLIFPLKIARPPTIFVRALGESPVLGHAARAAVFERRVRQILKFPLRACCLKRAS